MRKFIRQMWVNTTSFFQCDGYSLDLHNGPSLEGIALLNIPSIYGGTNLWGDNPSQKKRRKAQKQMKKDKEKELSTSSMSSIELGIAVQGELNHRVKGVVEWWEQGYRNFEIQIGPLDDDVTLTCVRQSQIVTKTHHFIQKCIRNWLFFW